MPLDTLALVRMALQTAPDSKSVVFGSVSTVGVLNDDEQMADDGTGSPVSVRTREVFVVRDAFTGLVDGSTLSIGGVAYTVRGRPRPRENGDLWAITVARIDA